MNINNETCVQKVILRFQYDESFCLKEEKKILVGNFINLSAYPARVRELKHLFESRLERIAQMMELLLESHDEWTVISKRHCFQMETVSFDFKKVEAILKDHGFTSKQYDLEVEYARKWGVL